MSSYGYDDGYRRAARGTRTYEPEYVDESTYVSRSGGGRPSTELVYRGRDDDVEEVTRDFPPGSDYGRSRYGNDYDNRRARSTGNRGGTRYNDDGYSDYGAAGYARRGGDRRSRDDDYYSDYTASERPRHRERRKSKVEELAEGVGLGGLAAALTGKGRSRSHSRERDGRSRRRDSDSSANSGTMRTRSQENRKKWQQAAKAAVLTGVIEAVRSRNEPGGWTGPKGQRALTAALGAAAVDGFVDRNPDKKSTRHIIESVIGGLAANRLANGPREASSRGRSLSRSRSRSPSRSRSRSGLSIRERFRSLSRGRSASRGPVDEDGRPRSKSRAKGLAELAGAGAVLAAGKAIYDRVRSKSRGRANSNGRDRSASASSQDSFVPRRRQQYQRDRGQGNSNRDQQDDEVDDDKVRRPRGRVAERQAQEDDEGGDEEKKRSTSSDSVSTTDLENQRKKSKRTEILTAGLATVATIHAAHGVYSSMVASEKRHKLVEEGKLSPEEARKRKSKNMLQDVAAVGIAALGIKSAYSEWKEMNEQRHGVLELETKKRKKRKLKEKAEREAKEARDRITYGQGPDGGMGGGAYASGYPASSYMDGNPYAGSMMQPPVGARY